MRASHLGLAVLSALALALAPALASAQEQSDDARRERLEGTWRLAVSQSRAESIRDAAVDRVVSQMSFFVRSIARSRLTEGAVIDREIRLRFLDDAQIRVDFASRAHYTTHVGRTERRRRGDGTPMRVTQRFREDGSLEQVFQTDGGARYFIYRPVGEGRIEVEIITTSDRLPQPVRYTLSYRRG